MLWQALSLPNTHQFGVLRNRILHVIIAPMVHFRVSTHPDSCVHYPVCSPGQMDTGSQRSEQPTPSQTHRSWQPKWHSVLGERGRRQDSSPCWLLQLHDRLIRVLPDMNPGLNDITLGLRGLQPVRSLSEVVQSELSCRLLGRDTTGWMIIISLIWGGMTAFLQFEMRTRGLS